VICQEVYESGLQAQRIIERAKNLERETLERAAAQAERIRDQARATGLEEGRAEVAKLLFEAHMLRDQTLVSAEKEIIHIAIAAAERIVGYACERDPEAIARIVSPVLLRARGAQQVTVRVHPLDVEGLKKASLRLSSEAELSDGICIEPDPAMARGGCMVCTEAGTLEARIEVQLAALERALNTST
jgi:flagellar biosynthesis/type III secretory pathway protein FliH